MVTERELRLKQMEAAERCLGNAQESIRERGWRGRADVMTLAFLNAIVELSEAVRMVADEIRDTKQCLGDRMDTLTDEVNAIRNKYIDVD